jgi:hypothetical protein
MTATETDIATAARRFTRSPILANRAAVIVVTVVGVLALSRAHALL